MEEAHRLSSLAARELKRLRRWEDEFGHVGSQEKTWKVMLQLYLSWLEGEDGMTVKSLWLYSGLPETTALRMFKMLEKEGHLRKIRNPEDSRSFLIALSPELTERIARYLGSVALNREQREAAAIRARENVVEIPRQASG